jgi:hypothetical protein
MGLCVARVQCNRRAAFVKRRIEVADPMESLRQTQSQVGAIRSQADRVALRADL